MIKNLIWVMLLGLFLSGGLVIGYVVNQIYGSKNDLLSPVFNRTITKDTHLTKSAFST